MKKFIHSIQNEAATFLRKTRAVSSDTSGEGYIDTAIKILLAVVLGALLLAGLYALFSGTVLPELTRRIQEMFNYNG